MHGNLQQDLRDRGDIIGQGDVESLAFAPYDAPAPLSYEDGLRAGLEAAAKIAEHIGIKDVNIDCRSGSRIAHAIRQQKELLSDYDADQLVAILT